MTGSRAWLLSGVSLTLLLTLSQHGWSQSSNIASPAVHKNAAICKIYPLAGLADDPNLGRWIADTLPEVIQPGSWNLKKGRLAATSFASSGGGQEEKRTLSYYEPGKLLVVYHTRAVHAQVDEFLKALGKALPQERGAKGRYESSEYPKPAFDTDDSVKSTAVKPRRSTSKDRNLVQSQYVVPAADKITDSVLPDASIAYPIPAPLQQPKHLFHLILRSEGDEPVDADTANAIKSLGGSAAAREVKAGDAKFDSGKSAQPSSLFQFIIRYEGDGIIDANVVELVKAWQKLNADREERPANNIAVPYPMPVPYAIPAPPTPPAQAPVTVPFGGLQPTAPAIIESPVTSSPTGPPPTSPTARPLMPPADPPPFPDPRVTEPPGE